VSKDNMEEAIRTGFDKSTKNNITSISSKIDQLISAGFKDEIAIGDIFDLIYLPGTGTTLYKNNASVVNITGLDFKKALFGIWLCDQPADEIHLQSVRNSGLFLLIIASVAQLARAADL
jgi:hypothetical protein